jgi:hypothetical protein
MASTNDKVSSRRVKNGLFTLSETGMILVAVPLIFELGLALTLSDTLSKIEKQTISQLHSKAIVSTAGQINNGFISMAMYLTWWKYSKDPSIGAQYQNAVAAAHDSVDRLILLTRDNPDQNARALKIRQYGLEADAVVARFAKPILSGVSALIEGPRFLREMRKSFVPMLEELEVLVQEENNTLTKVKPDLEGLFKTICFGLLANLLLSCFLALFFAKSIIARIDRLTYNLKCCAERTELPPTLQGRDEFVHLDRVFHQFNDSLTSIERQKREFVSMINRDLRTPLTTLQYVLALALRGSYGEFSERQKEVLLEQEDKLLNLVDYVNDFLAEEQKKAEVEKASTAEPLDKAGG